jgi:SAM-dependent methyltransferase
MMHPSSLIADLRSPGEDSSTADRWSQWSCVAMMEVSALDTFYFVKAMLPGPKLRIAEIGCGTGYLSLELAREGHEVIGIDASAEALQIAERTRAAHPDPAGFGRLTYRCQDLFSWQAEAASFDAVVLNRVLHHLQPLQPALAKIKQVLIPGGWLICQDYAYDRLSESTASWLSATERLLWLSGLADEDPTTAESDAQAVEALRTAWFQRAEHHQLNRADEMLPLLQTLFQQQMFAWVPYLFISIGNSLRHATPEQRRALLTFLKNRKQYVIDQGQIQAVGFRYAGRT